MDGVKSWKKSLSLLGLKKQASVADERSNHGPRLRVYLSSFSTEVSAG